MNKATKLANALALALLGLAMGGQAWAADTPDRSNEGDAACTRWPSTRRATA